jgi:hypothetical protein
MDANASYPLVPLRAEQESLVPVCLAVSVGHDSKPDLLAWLWQRFCRLALRFFLTLIVLRRLRLQLIELRQQANFWRAQHQRAVQREANLAEQIHDLQGQIRELERRLYGRKSETSSSTHPQTNAQTPPNIRPRRSRGQQHGSQGHGRRKHDHLPTTHEDCDLPADQKCCPDCGGPFDELPGTADGTIFEIDVRAHRRRYHRRRYRRH